VSAAVRCIAQATCTGPPKIVTTQVFIVSSRGLPDAGWFPGEDRFLSCTMRAVSMEVGGSIEKGEDIFSTRRIKNVVDPIWREETCIPEATASLEFNVWKADGYGMSGLLASTSLMSNNGNFDFSRGFNGELPLHVQGDENADAHLTIQVQAEDNNCNNHNDYPQFEGLAPQFTASISNPTRRNLGIDMGSQGGEMLRVSSLRAGPIMAYNSAVELDQQILPGHFVVSVNGVKGSTNALQRELRKNSRLEVIIRRPEDLRVAINVDGRRSLGLGIPRRPTGNTLPITQVYAGPVQDWNAENPWQEVRVGDRILAVNGQRGKASDLWKMLKAAMKLSRVQLTVTRPISLDTEPACLM